MLGVRWLKFLEDGTNKKHNKYRNMYNSNNHNKTYKQKLHNKIDQKNNTKIPDHGEKVYDFFIFF